MLLRRLSYLNGAPLATTRAFKGNVLHRTPQIRVAILFNPWDLKGLDFIVAAEVRKVTGAERKAVN